MIEHLSYSAIRSYATDRTMFAKRYIKKEYGSTKSPAMIEGNAVHIAIERMFKGLPELDIEDLWEIALGDDVNIAYGKTQNEEKSKENIMRAIEYFKTEMPDDDFIGEVVDVEPAFKEICLDNNGDPLPIPLKGKIDMVINRDGEIHLIDWKVVTKYIDESKQNLVYKLQAACYFLICRVVYDTDPESMTFLQIKKTKNRDDSPQLRRYVVENNDPRLIDGFCEMIRRIIRELTGEPNIDPSTGEILFIPNPFDMLSGDESWKEFMKSVPEGLETFEEALDKMN